MTGSKETKITGRAIWQASTEVFTLRRCENERVPLMEREFGLTIVFSFITPEETSGYQT
jgi:hypothetical protein